MPRAKATPQQIRQELSKLGCKKKEMPSDSKLLKMIKLNHDRKAAEHARAYMNNKG